MADLAKCPFSNAKRVIGCPVQTYVFWGQEFMKLWANLFGGPGMSGVSSIVSRVSKGCNLVDDIPDPTLQDIIKKVRMLPA